MKGNEHAEMLKDFVLSMGRTGTPSILTLTLIIN